MTSRHSPTSALRTAPGADAPIAAAMLDRAPYAQPADGSVLRAVDAVVIDALRVATGPYVPEPWRTRPAGYVAPAAPVAAVVQDDSLPWIDAFLDDAGRESATVEFADDSTAVVEHAEAVIERNEATMEFVASAAIVEPVAEVAAEPTVDAVADDLAEEWPLAEAGDAFRHLVDSSAASGAMALPAMTPVEPPVVPPSLPMWSDDDMMDIMPVSAEQGAPSTDGHWADQARRESRTSGTREAAANVLESLAQRVREGELTLTGYSPEMSDAATLAAALASLLGVRR